MHKEDNITSGSSDQLKGDSHVQEKVKEKGQKERQEKRQKEEVKSGHCQIGCRIQQLAPLIIWRCIRKEVPAHLMTISYERLHWTKNPRKRCIPFVQTLMLDILFDSRTRSFFIYLVINIIFGAVIYHWLEGWNWLDSFYFVVITLTTIGYGDFSPTTRLAKLITIFYSINGVIMLLFLFDMVRTVRGWQHGQQLTTGADTDRS